MRTLYRTKEFDVFFDSVDEKVRKKIAYIFEILTKQQWINSKIAKKLTNTDLYELRVQVGNEYRILIFTIDSEDVNQSKNILLISAFHKKATKEYKKEIIKALKILEQWQEQN